MGPGEGIQRQRLIDLTTTLVDPELYMPPQPQPRVSKHENYCKQTFCVNAFFFVAAATTREITAA